MAKPIVHGVKERPILFSGAMVRALLDGSKTQTRRVVKVQPDFDTARAALGGDTTGAQIVYDHVFGGIGLKRGNGSGFVQPNIHCPYGQPGDRLWAKEDWQALHKYNGTKIADIPVDDRHWVNFPASGTIWDAQRRAARFMPRWASRILLEIVSVRVERLQDISDEDCVAEGVRAIHHDGDGAYYHHEHSYADPGNWCHPDDAYRALWESINGPGSWDANPWVWAITFRRVAA
jgi:hypothetical protein